MAAKLKNRPEPARTKNAPNQHLIWASNSFGEVIRKGRLAKGFTQKQLAQRSGGISAMFISQIETGERFPSVRICQLLAEALELDEEKLLKMIHRSKAPKEIKQLLTEADAEALGASLCPRLKSLVESISTLSERDQEYMARVIEIALEGAKR